MACICITQYFQLKNGAKTSTRIVFCRFLIKSYQDLVNILQKYKDQRRLPRKKISQKLVMCYFVMGSKRVSNSSPVFISSEFIKGKSDTLFDT
jgi:hypothetical protein